jgi:hypothetical protein
LKKPNVSRETFGFFRFFLEEEGKMRLKCRGEGWYILYNMRVADNIQAYKRSAYLLAPKEREPIEDTDKAKKKALFLPKNSQKASKTPKQQKMRAICCI